MPSFPPEFDEGTVPAGSARLTPNQERLWFLHRLDPASVSYSLPWVLELRGPLDVDALSRSLDRILERHAPLRCRFVEVAGEPRMVPHDAAPLDLVATPLDAETSLDEALRREIAKPLDLADGPILRFRLFQLSPEHHALTWTVHHIVYDLSSYNVMLDELEVLYPLLRGGAELDEPTLDPLSITYGDYTARVRQRAEQGESEAALAHWKRALSGFEPLELPLDRPRPSRPLHPASVAVRRVDHDLTEALRRLARDRGRSTVFTPTLAAFYLLLRGLSGQDDLVLGVPIAGRDEPDTRSLVGFFVDVLALRVDLSDDPTFGELVDRAQDLFLDARRYPQPPLGELADELAQNRRAGENPFFPATFQLAREPRAPRLPDLDIRQSRLRADNVKFDIRMDVYDRRDHLSLEIEFDTEILDPETIERWFDIYVGLLDQAVADPDRPISTLDLLTDGDRRVIRGANDNATDFPGELSLITQVRERAAAHPDKLAVVHGDRRWSWAQLTGSTDRLAARLAAAGVRPGDFVGLCVERGAELPLGMLAILAAGGAYTSLDPNYPDDRLRFMIEDAGLDVLVVQRHLIDRLPEVDGVTLVAVDDVLDEGTDGESSVSVTPPALDRLDGDFPACLIYTSGSTGAPKASVLPQRGITRLVVATNYAAFTSADVFTQTSSPSFDAATFEVWGALLHGGTLVVVDREDLLSPRIFGETLRREGATVVFLTTAYFQQVARQAPEVFETPRAVFFGGERCEPDAVRSALEACRRGGCRLFHAYGPSECTTYATVGEVDAVPDDATSVPIGGPIANTGARVVDPLGREVPVGVAGELWLGGPGLALAYHDRPRLTAERFIPDRFATRPGARLYRTGDRVRWLADGSFDFLGRIDHQVKLRGFRIEPGEIEAALEQHPQVADALVMVREDVPGDRRLAAYVTAVEADEPPTGAALRSHLGAEMPAYMVPAAIVVLDTLPLTANGKVDRRALPAPERDVETAFRAPETGTEHLLAELWREALGIERIGRDDDLFALGGHSLVAVRLVSRLRDRLGVELPVRAIFDSPRLEDLARRIDHLVEAHDRADADAETLDDGALAEAIAAARQRGVLSFGQRRLWFLAQLDPGSTAYNMPLALELGGSWDRRALERALSAIVARHEILRTRYVEAAGEPRAVVDEPTEVRLAVETVDSAAARDAILAAEAATPFDLGRSVVRWRLIEPTPGAGFAPVLLAHVHHIAFDGWSWGIVRREIETLHDALAADPSIDPTSLLAPLPMQYGDHAARQNAVVADRRLAAMIEPWRHRLAGLEPLELPADRPRTGSLRQPAAVVRRRLADASATAVRGLARQRGRTLFTTLLTAFVAHLQALTGHDDIALGVPDAGRSQSDLERLVGFFIDMIVVRNDLSGNPSFDTLTERVQRALLDARAHAEVPFDKLVEELRPEREPGRNPFFQVAFQVVDGGMIGRDDHRATGIELSEHPIDLDEAKFDLTVAVIDFGDRLRLDVIYAADRFEASTIDRWLDGFEHLLDQVTGDPDRRLAELDVLPPADRALILDVNRQANVRSDAHFPGDVSLIEQVRRHVEADPDGVAVVHRDVSIRRRELLDRAERLARQLIAAGVRPGDLVGLCLEPGPRLIVGALGAHAAGAAYVPLDAAYPPDRLRFMIGDADLAVLISEAALLDALPEVDGVPVLDFDALPPDAPAATALPRVDGDFPAYAIFTSGSTGRPKGAVVPQRAVTRLLVDTDWFEIGRDDVVAQVVSPSFDASSWEIWSALLHGATLAIIDRDEVRIPERLAEAFERHGVTASVITTAYFQQVARQAPAAISRLRWALYGGERCDPEAIRHAVEISRNGGPDGTGTRVLNVYGPTECAVMAAVYHVEDVPADATSVPIGPPIARTTTRVMDIHGREVGVGVPGELWIGGPGVGLGYHGRPALTANVFVPDPFSEQPGARCYRTGDLVRWLPNGVLDYLGRIDQQVKLRGYRIELGEVESMLSRHPFVADAVAMVREDTPGNPRLVAYATPAEGMHRPESQALREFLAEELPEFMVPTVVMVLDHLPLTPRDKVDRRALPVPELETDAALHVAPRTAEETALAAVWSEVLGVTNPSVRTSFFELGGHSLLAVQLSSRLRDRLGLDVQVRQLFERPTIEELAEWMTDAPRDLPGGPDASDDPARRDAIAAARARGVLSFAQRRLWFLSQLDPESTAYNMPIAWRLDDGLDRPALARALSEILRRHEILRGRYALAATDDGLDEPRMVVEPAVAVDLAAIRRTVDSPAALDAALRAEAATPFDLASGPLRLILFEGADGVDMAPVLMFHVHHIAFDGWSVGLLRRELRQLHDGFAADPRRSAAEILPEPTVQYADHAARQSIELSPEILAEKIEPWRQRLAGLEPLELPSDRPHANRRRTTAAVARRTLPIELVDATRELARRQGRTVFSILLGAFAATLQGLTGRDDFAIGIPEAGRGRTELEGVLGCFVEMLVVRLDSSGDPTAGAQIDRVHEAILDARDHRDVPLETLAEALQPDRQTSGNPFFQVAFQVLDETIAGTASTADGLRLTDVPLALPEAKFDLTLDVADRADGITLAANYIAEAFEPTTLDRWLEGYETLLRQWVENPQRRLSHLDLLTARDRALIEGANLRADTGSDTTSRGNASLFEQIRGFADSQPDKAAVLHNDSVVSWRELLARASALGLHLVDRGVRPGDFVGLCVERGPHLIEGVLGIVAAGAAYVPLDAEYPDERLRVMIEDAGLRILVTEPRTRDGLPSVEGVELVDLGALPTRSAESETALPRVDGDFPAYVIFTSGSTGRPKGTVVPQRAVSHLVVDTEHFEHRPDDVVAQVVSPSFDGSAVELWSCLLHGATIAVIDRQDLLSPTALAAVFARHRVTVSVITTAYFQQLAREVPQLIAQQRLSLYGGERCDPDVIRHAAEVARQGGTRLFNVYGPTEVTVFSAVHEVRSVPDDATSVPIGPPTTRTKVHVVDALDREVGLGIPGELWVGGPGVAMGYHGRPALTAAAFVPDPFAEHPGARCYRTGDLVRWLDGGILDYLGRIDHQVKLRGYRIELGEIEAVLARHDDVAATCVLLREDQPGDPRLVAYVTAEPSRTVDAPALRQQLADALPAHMVPATILVLDTLPTTPNGKIDRRALPAPEIEQAIYRPPETILEIAIGHAWMEVLDLDQVGLDDDFFAIGGHSLIATQIAARLSSILGLHLPLHLLFDNPRLGDMAAAATRYVLDQPHGADTLELLEELESMSDEERELLGEG